MGFEKALIAEANADVSKEIKNMEIITANNIRKVMDILF